MPGLGLGLLNVAFALVFGWAVAEREAMERREHRTAERLRSARARALQNQLEPHVLFNALNSLSELVHEDPLAAEEVIARLADLYRRLAVYGQEDLVTLGQERSLVEAYLAMEEMRLGERLRVAWDWPEWADREGLPPLFLQPLVENAIKHGISPCDAGGELEIRCGRTGGEVFLQVRNTGRPLSEARGTGVGLENLRARLDLWPGASARFTLEREGAWTVATLRWTQEAA